MLLCARLSATFRHHIITEKREKSIDLHGAFRNFNTSGETKYTRISEDYSAFPFFAKSRGK